MYFSSFPKILYAFQIGSELSLRVVTDITLNIRPIRDILENITFYEDYDVFDGDTPEVIAERLYGNPNLHWVIMLVNEKYHYIDDFPIPESKFDEHVTKLYGAGNEHATHSLYGRPHYVSLAGRIVDSTYPQAMLVTNTEYERTINDGKRRIRIVNPRLIGTFVKDLQDAFEA